LRVVRRFGAAFAASVSGAAVFAVPVLRVDRGFGAAVSPSVSVFASVPDAAAFVVADFAVAG
jgi:hypothetical protein